MIVPEILITSGKEVILNIGLKQAVKQLNAVTVQAVSRKDITQNTMESVSSRSFTVEEANRYARGLDDPGRLVSSFVGVTIGNLEIKSIIIRGNSPKNVLWR